uniref:Chloride channel protein n=1 Tax=Aceria tosichella TaxID=561515 RepID=A0A6G1SH30_9ACAR
MVHDNCQRTLSRKYESLDYDLIENVIYLEHQHKARFKNYISRELQRWLAILLIGLATAASGFFAFVVVDYLSRIKYTWVISLSNRPECINNATTNDDHSTQTLTNVQILKCILQPYAVLIAWNSLFILAGASMVTYLAPVAAGSGIPVVKCYLNGVKIPQVVRFKTYVTKLLGVVSSVVGGLAVGKEGPFIQCGAAIGAGLSQGKSTSFNFDLNLFKAFRNDRDKRDFVSAGASAGVAAAFGAPIGGVLFALEEGASFWNQALTWRLFFCSMTTSFAINLMMCAYNHQGGILAFHSLVNFGLVEELDYFWYEIPIYVCIAICGGLIGASFCHAHVAITNFRQKYISSNRSKVFEAVFVTILTATAGIILILYAAECRKLPRDDDEFDFVSGIKQNQTSHRNSAYYKLFKFSGSRDDGGYSRKTSNYSDITSSILTYDGDAEIRRAISGHILTFICPPGEYSAMSSLWLKTSEGVASTFMILQENIWSMKTLSIFFVVYYCLAVITYGLSVSAGVFIPSLLVGAAGGRLIGAALLYLFGPQEWLVQQNKFAIVGAVSVLGGIVRMTISLTVIVIEATGCISFGMPIMICLMVSKWVADSFIEGLYDLAIKMANVPFLEWEPPLKSHTIYASDIMEPNVKVLQTTETVANLINILKSTTHNGFPVVDIDGFDGASEGMDDSGKYYVTPASRKSRMMAMSDEDRDSIDSRIIKPAHSQARGYHHDGSTNQGHSSDDFLTGSFQRCSVSAKRESHGRFRGLVLRWQLLVMLELKIFNENERSYEKLNLEAFQQSYPSYPDLDQVVAGLSEESYKFHVDLRSIMNPTPYIVHHSSSFPRIFQIFRSLGLRHLVVIDDRNQVVGMITRKDLARYVRERDSDGLFRFYELEYSS